MASSRITGTNEIVETFGDGTRDRTSMAAWEGVYDLTLTSGYEQATVSSLTGHFDKNGEVLNFSPSGATANSIGHSADDTKLYYVVTSGTPTSSDSISGATSGESCDIDSIDSTNTGISPVLECYDDSSSFDVNCQFDGSVTSSSYFRILRPASGEGHDGTPNNGFHIHCTTNQSTIDIREQYFHVSDLIVQHTINLVAGARYGIYVNSAGGNTTVANCILLECVNNGAGDPSRGIGLQISTAKAINNLAIRVEYAGLLAISACTLFNNTAVDCDVGVRWAGYTATVRNNLAHSNTTNDMEQGSTGDYNASSDGTATNGTNSRTNQTFTFVNGAGDDWQITSADAGAKGYGNDESATFDDDIEGTTRSTPWDIGAFKFETVGGGFPSELLAHERRNTLLRM